MGTFAPTMISNPGFTSLISRPKLHPSCSPSHKPLRITMSNHQSYLTSISNDVEDHIHSVLSGRQPPNVFEPMHHLALATPTSMGSALCLAACELVGGSREQAIPVASALHLMHSAAFTHENLSLSDQPKFKPSALHDFDTNIELLTGDSLLPLGYEIVAGLCNEQTQVCSARVLRLIVEISTTMGSQGMVNGQYVQQQCIMGLGPDGDDSAGWVYHVCEKKEGGLYACGAACGAIVGGGGEEEIKTLRRFGYYVGMIDGMMKHGKALEEKELLGVMEHYRYLALKELESFQDRNIDTVTRLLDEYLLKKNQSITKSECFV